MIFSVQQLFSGKTHTKRTCSPPRRSWGMCGIHVLYELHWLPVFYCIYFKILSIISESISNRSCSRYSLRLHCFIVLDHPKECMPATLSTRLFSTAAPTWKNSLPAHIHDIESLSTFKRHVKTCLFILAFT